MLEIEPPQGGFFVPSEMTTEDVNAAEEIIERGLKTFMEVGWALLDIRDRRGYRFTHATFEDYCRERWGMRHQNADRLIRSAEVAGLLNPIGFTPTESQARELAPLLRAAPESIPDAWQEAVSLAPDGKVTAALIEKVVERRLNPGVLSSETSEWYTPPEIIERVLRLFGRIDLDPCAELARAIPAVQHFTWLNNGLLFDWPGAVYMNPPYGDDISEWVNKLWSEFRSKHTREAIALLPARTDTRWFQVIWDNCPVCFIRGRLKFSGNDNSAPFPSVVAYFGSRTAAFIAAFGDMGTVVAKL